MEIYEVVKKLIGEIEPIGETNEDNKRYKNLEDIIKLTDKLIFDIEGVSIHKDRHEHSMKCAGKKASGFLKELKESL